MSVGSRIMGFLKKVGPGFLTGVADDDPSGIGTSSIAGVQVGYAVADALGIKEGLAKRLTQARGFSAAVGLLAFGLLKIGP